MIELSYICEIKKFVVYKNIREIREIRSTQRTLEKLEKLAVHKEHSGN